jgi:hypothetical protein
VLNAGKPGAWEKEANGDVAGQGKEDKAKGEEEKVMEGTKNLDLNAGANGNGGFSLLFCCVRATG